MFANDDILTVSDVATELRCSKTHIHNAIKGKVTGVSQLPAICMGRRKLIRRSALEKWKTANERNSINGMMPKSSEIDAA
jgi:excisionase family DNA binding protein